MVYTISIFEDKTIKCDKNIHINYKENEIDEILFDLPTFLNDFTKICVLYTPNRKKLELPINDNKIIVSSEITTKFGDWKLCLVATNGEKIFISDELLFKVDKTYIDSSIAEEIDANLDLLILELENTLKKLDDTKIEEIGSVVEELKAIKEAISNINVDVDLTPVLNAIDLLDGTLSIIDSKIDSIPNYTSDLNTIKNGETTIQGMIQSLIASNQGQFSQVLSNTNNIPSIITSISNLKELVNKIPTNDYTDEIKSIKDIVDGIDLSSLESDMAIIKDQLTNVSTAGTIANNTKWSLTRAEEAKSISQQIYQLLTDVALKLDEF